LGTGQNWLGLERGWQFWLEYSFEAHVRDQFY
jgi:hypothetical protein